MKTALITGIINKKSIAYAIAKQLYDQGYKIIMTCQIDNPRNYNIRDELNADLYILDVEDEKNIIHTLETIKEKYTKISATVHAIAFSDKNQLTKDFFTITQDNFNRTMNISCYSFIALVKNLYRLNMLESESSIIALSYYGATKVIPHYNIMGIAKSALESSVKYLAAALGPENIRVNAISAAPIRTVASSGISDFHYMLEYNKTFSPLQRNITLEDIAKSAFYLLSDLSSGVTGEIHYVDGGYNIVGMSNPYYKMDYKIPEEK